MTELLVPAYRTGEEQKVDELYAILSRFPHLEWVSPDLEIADLAAEFRALHRLKIPDAIQAATAVRAAASGLITNDPVFTRVTQFETLLLDRDLP
jgi:predicted nucleic acid-binding protein